MRKFSFRSILSLTKKNKQKRLKRLALRWIAQMPFSPAGISEVRWQEGLPSVINSPSPDPLLLSFDLIGKKQSHALVSLLNQSKCRTVCFAFRVERPCPVGFWVDLLDEHRFHKREVRKLPWPLKAHIAFAHRSSL